MNKIDTIIERANITPPKANAGEQRPSKLSGWREDKARTQAASRAIVGHGLNVVAMSAWKRGPLIALSTLDITEYPDASGELGPTWHISVSKRGKIPGDLLHVEDKEFHQALACFRFVASEEDNHEHGFARHAFRPFDPKRRRSCECKVTEIQVVEPDGHRWSAAKDPSECGGCANEKVTGRRCSVHPSLAAVAVDADGDHNAVIAHISRPDHRGVVVVERPDHEGARLRAWDNGASPDELRADLAKLHETFRSELHDRGDK